jgi:hypothetical protein
MSGGNVVPLADARKRAGFDRLRWDWAEAVSRAPDLSSLAKLLGYVLVAQFAHRETADCHPGWMLLAEATGASERTVRRAIADLERAGFLQRGPGGYSGVRVSLLFRIGGRPLVVGSTEKVANPDHQKVAISDHQKVANPDHQSGEERWPVSVEKVAISGVPPTPPYKDKPNSNQRGGADRSGESGGGSAGVWAAAIREGRYVPPSALRPDQARDLLREGEVTEADLRRCGIAW